MFWRVIFSIIIEDLINFNVRHPEVFNTYINIQCSASQTQQNFFIMFIIYTIINIIKLNSVAYCCRRQIRICSVWGKKYRVVYNLHYFNPQMR